MRELNILNVTARMEMPLVTGDALETGIDAIGCGLEARKQARSHTFLYFLVDRQFHVPLPRGDHRQSRSELARSIVPRLPPVCGGLHWQTLLRTSFSTALL